MIKQMKRLLQTLALVAICLSPVVVSMTGCTTTQTRYAYNSLYTVEHVTHDAYSGYIDSVIARQTSTNGVPQVSSVYNKFQASFLVVLSAAQFNTNALAPASLEQESRDVINLIITLKNR
jgi:hypothetical protein